VALKVTADRVKDVLASIKALTKHQVLVGIPADAAERQPDADDPRPPNNAEIGFIQEFGSPEANIPARPFLVPGVRGNLEKIEKRYRTAAQKALDGDKEAVEKAHMAIGLETASAVQKKITDGPFVPLSPVTIANRKARGRTGINPLLDTGQLRRSITYVIRDGKK
jgi:phage gpG-like protein